MSQSVQFQTTVARAVTAEGIALHTGLLVQVRIGPAAADEGICFVRTDLPGAPCVRVTPEAVNHEALQRRTELLGPQGAIVATPEHLLAAALGMGLDNARIELNGPELPIFDGSVRPFVEMIKQAGLAPLAVPRRCWRLRRPVGLVLDHASIFAVPSLRMDLAFFAELRHAGMDNQSIEVTLTPEVFEDKLAPSRTFCFFEEVERLRAAGLIRGGSLECAIVIKNGKPLDDEYRLPDELACHKLIDLIGDLAVLGRPIHAFISAHGTGHALHHAFIDKLRKELFEDV